eukprot:scaffold229977_cov30-Tisochrysis_lutea.AAC.3
MNSPSTSKCSGPVCVPDHAQDVTTRRGMRELAARDARGSARSVSAMLLLLAQAFVYPLR